jgi:hypothetical protein
MRVKAPGDSKYPWDYIEVVAKIAAAEAFRPPGAGGCAGGAVTQAQCRSGTTMRRSTANRSAARPAQPPVVEKTT